MEDILLRYQLNLDMYRGQCYDDASNMLGKSSGLSNFLEQPKAHYTHCHAHLLSLSVKDVAKNTKVLRDTLGSAEEITILIKYSPKRQNILRSIMEQIECENDSGFYANNLLTLWKHVGQWVQYVSKRQEVDCFDSFLSEIRKFPREQRLLPPCSVHMCRLLLVNPNNVTNNLNLKGTANIFLKKL